MNIGNLEVTDDLSIGSFREVAAKPSSRRSKEEANTGRPLVCHIRPHSVADQGVVMMSVGRTSNGSRKASDPQTLQILIYFKIRTTITKIALIIVNL